MTRDGSAGSADATRVVVIDDDEFERAFLVDLLRRAGLNASSMPSMIGVTNHVIREEIEVVVLDVMMPTIRGDKLAALLRKNPALPQLGVVMVSSLPQEEVAQLMTHIKVDAFVSKANVRTELAAAVKLAALRRSQNDR